MKMNFGKNHKYWKMLLLKENDNSTIWDFICSLDSPLAFSRVTHTSDPTAVYGIFDYLEDKFLFLDKLGKIVV